MKRIKATPELMERMRKAREELNISRQENLVAQEEARRKEILNEMMQQHPARLTAIEARRSNILNGRAFPKIRVVESIASTISTEDSENYYKAHTNSASFKRGRLGQQPSQSTNTFESMNSKKSNYRPSLPGCASTARVQKLIEARSGSYSTNPNSFLSNKNSSGFAGRIRKTVAQQRTPK